MRSSFSSVALIHAMSVSIWARRTERSSIRVLRTADGQKTDLRVDGVFLAVGLIPQNEPFADLIALDARGYADTDESCVTKTAGVFVAGDCRAKRIRQVTTAAADGAIAALAACDYIDQQNG